MSRDRQKGERVGVSKSGLALGCARHSEAGERFTHGTQTRAMSVEEERAGEAPCQGVDVKRE